MRTYPCAHFDIYLGEWRERAVADQVHFLRRHLGVRVARTAQARPSAPAPRASAQAPRTALLSWKRGQGRGHAGLRGRGRRALARGPCRRRLLGRVVRPLPRARPRPGKGRGRPRGAVELAKVDVTRTSSSPPGSASRAFPRSRPSGTARWSPSSSAPSLPPRSSSSSTRSSPPRPSASPPPATKIPCAGRWARPAQRLGGDLAGEGPPGPRRCSRGSEVLEPIGALDFVADGLRARIGTRPVGRNTGDEGATNGTLAAAFGAWDEDDPAAALERLQRSWPAPIRRIGTASAASWSRSSPSSAPLTLSPQSTAAASPRP